MSDDVYWKTAQAECTEKELEALDLTRRGYSTRLAALTLGISREAVKDRLARADRKIHNALNQPKENRSMNAHPWDCSCTELTDITNSGYATRCPICGEDAPEPDETADEDA